VGIKSFHGRNIFEFNNLNSGNISVRAPCKLGCEGIVSKRLASIYRRGRSPYWIKVKPESAAVKREAEEDWGR